MRTNNTSTSNNSIAEGFELFWGETHHNTYQRKDQDPSLDVLIGEARKHLDFYAAAYYMAEFTNVPVKEQYKMIADKGKKGHPGDLLQGEGIVSRGVFYESEKTLNQLESDWLKVQDATRKHNTPGEFVTFPGYEWQGDCTWGDHNVFFKDEGAPIFNDPKLPDLYRKLAAFEAMAIPHHTAYRPGTRAPDWRYCDEKMSPFTEIYSVHGCSEADGLPDSMRANGHMGPGVGGGTWENALNHGLHLGAIGSTDNWTDAPGRWGNGLMGCWAETLTREGLWKAFQQRRVYAVTGDRIQLWFEVNGKPMGSINPMAKNFEGIIRGQGSDRVERIELLRDNKVIRVFTPGEFTKPSENRYWKLRLEQGWGPKVGELPIGPKQWKTQLKLDNGVFLDWEPIWMSGTQNSPQMTGQSLKFEINHPQEQASHPYQNGIIVGFEAPDSAEIQMSINAHTESFSIDRLKSQSHLLSFDKESAAAIAHFTGSNPSTFPRESALTAFAYKCRIGQLVSASESSFNLPFEVSLPTLQKTQFRVRVIQRNGQRAWSTPVWFDQ